MRSILLAVCNLTTTAARGTAQEISPASTARIETNVDVQRDEAIGVGAGWSDDEIGARVRYEIRREFAPYVGLTWNESFGATHRLSLQDGGEPSHFVVAAGVRTWF